jgi:amino acid transporter
LVSAAPPLVPYRVALGIAAITLVTLANLRGIRESGNIFAVPTYVFLAAMFGLIGTGLFLLYTGQLFVPPPTELPHSAAQPLTLFLILRAFATGSAVMTGTEAISNGIPAFKPPESRNAAQTIVAMAVILAMMFLGLSLLIVGSGVIPTHDETVISQLGRAVFGEGPLYLLIQLSAVLILVLAANTAYADFPRLASLLARDHYAPHQLAFRGERLAFSNGIVLLGLLSALLVFLFGGSTGALLPLYALSVFTAFTFSQAGMVVHWRRERSHHWHVKATINGVGALVTALVTLIAAVTNFMNPALPIIPGLPIGWGAWIVILIVPCMIWLFRQVHEHYATVDAATHLPPMPEPDAPLKTLVVVPIAKLNRPTVRALRYAKTLSADVTAVHVAADTASTADLKAAWEDWERDIPLTIIESPYRSLTRPLLQYLYEVKRAEAADFVTVILPEYVPDSLWEHFLHGQSAQFLKLSLLFKPGFVVTSVPYHEDAAASPGSAPAAAVADGVAQRGRG